MQRAYCWQSGDGAGLEHLSLQFRVEVIAADGIDRRRLWIQLVNAALQDVSRSVYMKRKPRIYYSDNQKALMWERWRQAGRAQSTASPRTSQENLDEVARLPNERPRKTLNDETPAQRFNQCVAGTD